MHAIIEDRGRQYRVAKGDRITLDRCKVDVGGEIEMAILLTAEGDKVEIGAPYLSIKAKVKVLAHTRGKKGIAGKFRRRKDSRSRRGFRHDHTQVEVLSIG